MSRLGKFDRCVQEGKALEEAVDFTRWLFFSGIITLCEMNPQPYPLKVDGAMLRWKCEDVQRKVQERFRLNDMAPHMAASELQTLHDKLDKIAGFLSRFPQPAVAAIPTKLESDSEASSHSMQFTVIPGGLAGDQTSSDVCTNTGGVECRSESDTDCGSSAQAPVAHGC